jgi:hypothetical protein
MTPFRGIQSGNRILRNVGHTVPSVTLPRYEYSFIMTCLPHLCALLMVLHRGMEMRDVYEAHVVIAASTLGAEYICVRLSRLSLLSWSLQDCQKFLSSQ